jgi:hypothetical protein
MKFSGSYIVIIILFFMVCALMVYAYRLIYDPSWDEIVSYGRSNLDENKRIKAKYDKLAKDYQIAKNTIYSDENIFAYMRCLNIPQKPICKPTSDGQTVCRSKLINCAQYIKIINEDPIAVQRMKLATERAPESVPVDTNYPFDDYFENLNKGFQ